MSTIKALGLAAGPALVVFACAASGTHDPGGGPDDNGGSDGGGAFGGESGSLTPSCNPCTDFPKDPIYDNGAPQNAGQTFGAPDNGASSGGPCLVEPEVGALFPQNWLRPRFRFLPPSGQTLFEIRVHADVETNDLVVYTTQTAWTMPRDMWKAVAAHVTNQPLTVTVRGTSGTGAPSKGTSGQFTIAPVAAEGTMVYWATLAFDSNAKNTKLQGFHVGDEGVVDALETTQVQEKVRATWGNSLDQLATQVQCIGCHTSTPDGKYAAFTAQWPWPNALASVEKDTVGAQPDFLSDGARSALSPNKNGAYSEPDVEKVMLGIQSYSKAHWAAGDRIAVSTRGSAWHRSTDPNDPGAATGVVAQLVWFNLEAGADGQGSAWDVIARGGDSNSAAAPSWSHDGNSIAYASTDTGAEDGRMGKGASDLVVVPYNNRAGGAVTKVQGASDPGFEEYYPAFSADDKLLAFNRVASGLSMYNQPQAEVYVIPAAGGQAKRLNANDPVACTGLKSPGVQNTWPKWAPEATRGSDGKMYHWLIFSSTRGGSHSQLYITAVVVDGSGEITTYPSIYLWNQDPTLNNLVPAWDVFSIPSPPIR